MKLGKTEIVDVLRANNGEDFVKGVFNLGWIWGKRWKLFGEVLMEA